MPELDLSLTQRGLVTNAHYLRETHMRLRAIKSGVATQLIILLLGDSWVQGNYWSTYFAKALHDAFGMAGVGFVGFAFFAPLTGGPWVEGGTQPTGRIDGNSRPDLVPAPILIGNWSSSYNSPGNGTPTLGVIYSSTAGDRVKFSFPAGHTSSRLFYNGNSSYGNGASVIRYSWDGGATWQPNITLSYQGSGQVDLLNTPAGAATLIIEVVSGTPGLAGVDIKSTASGVRVHKLGISGGSTLQPANTNSGWTGALGSLAPNLFIAQWGTNDRVANYDPAATFTPQYTTALARMRTANAYADVLLTAPPENAFAGATYATALYTAAVRSLARTSKCAFLDHQPNFGDAVADYAWSNANRQWLGSDLIHPVQATGGAVLANGVLEAVLPR